MNHLPAPCSAALQIDRFLYSTDNQVVAGALLAVGIVNCGVQDEVDPALALLSGKRWCLGVCRTPSCSLWSAVCRGGMALVCTGRAELAARTHATPAYVPYYLRPGMLSADYVSKDDPQTRIGAILGLGIAYAGRQVGCQRLVRMQPGRHWVVQERKACKARKGRGMLSSPPHMIPLRTAPDCTGLPFMGLDAGQSWRRLSCCPS